MSIGFGQNTIAFQLATAFTVGRIIRNALASKDVWSEYNFGYIDITIKATQGSIERGIVAIWTIKSLYS
jgi:hypothetical protein